MRLPTLAGIAAVPALRAFALSTVLWLLVYSYSHWALWRDPHGAYFHSDHIYDLDYSRVRRQEARAWLQHYAGDGSNVNDTTVNDANANKDLNATATDDPSLPPSPSPPPTPVRAGDRPVLCAAFVTVRRDHPDAAGYFADAVGSLVAGLSPAERAALHVNVLFANAFDPAQHPDYGAAWLTAVVDHAAGYEDLPEEEHAELRRLEMDRDFQVKGVRDYVYALERCYRDTRAPFIAVFEDDIYLAQRDRDRDREHDLSPDPPPPPPTSAAVTPTDIPPNTLRRAEPQPPPPWLYLRLFYSETFLLWDAATDWWYGHAYVTVPLVALTAVTGGGLRLPPPGKLKPRGTLRRIGAWIGTCDLGLRLDLPTIAVLAFVVAPGFTALVFMAGKYNLPMYALRGAGHALGDALLRGQVGGDASDAGVVLMGDHGCCTQALVFDRARVPDLAAYLRQRGRGQTDLMIEDYCRATPLRRFALGEQAVQHVGVASSRGSRSVDAQSVWAFYFETQRAEAVRQNQARALADVDWAFLDALQAPAR
ncbi:hypothetical protein SPI_00771 [Niveomyces insectorum RCEF 264]|uniref:Integral membrane protein n=1 Tax=Niveomyces insectorum RCEF 264 TaxID=1081102 RepID=A0A168ACV7_9HYPO|nr:hypothetical protein SPI_00771 [Niveomyces insectorum RCEF 264]